MYGGENDDIRKHFGKNLYDMGSVQLCSVIADLKVKLLERCFGEFWDFCKKFVPKLFFNIFIPF